MNTVCKGVRNEDAELVADCNAREADTVRVPRTASERRAAATKRNHRYCGVCENDPVCTCWRCGRSAPAHRRNP